MLFCMPLPSIPFESWLAALSLDADLTGLCPNLTYIPKSELCLLWADGCQPKAMAVALFVRPAPVSFAPAHSRSRAMLTLSATTS